MRLIDLVNKPESKDIFIKSGEGKYRDGYNQYKRDLESMNQKEVSAVEISNIIRCKASVCTISGPGYVSNTDYAAQAILTYLAGLKEEK